MTTGALAADNVRSDRPAPAWTRHAWLAIAAAVILAYANSLSVPLLLDDGPTITENESIRDLSRLGTVLSGGSVFTQGRPVLNLSFALNYAVGGTAVAGYHVVNTILHLLAAVVLWGVITRTLRLVRFGERFGVRDEQVALFAALLWALHPAQTASVTYVSQRAESLMGLFYLMMLYCLIRGGSARAWSWWHAGAIVACAIGMGVKEVMVTAPVAAFVYDVVFLSGSIRAAWRQHWRCHVGLAASWLVLALLMLGSGFEGRVVGTGVHMPAEPYVITEIRALARYFELMVWPHPLIFDYGIDQAGFERFTLGGSTVVLIAVVGLGIVAWRRSRALGFGFVWVFLVLAPTSSVVGVAGQRIAGNRIYLPLAAAAVLLPVVALAALPRRIALPAVGCVVVAFTGLTWRRNLDFHSALSLWRDTVAKLPESHRAHGWLGLALLDTPGKYPAAMSQLREAAQLARWDVDTYWNLGLGLVRDPNGLAEAADCFAVVVKARPNDAAAHAMLGTALLMKHTRLEDAATHLQTAVRLRPDRADFHRLLGTALLEMPGRRIDAIRELETATRLAPDDFEAFTNLGIAYLGDPPDPQRAIAAQRAALAINPRSHLAWFNLGVALAIRGEQTEAERCFERALELNPTFEPARSKLQELRANRPARP